MLALFCVFSLQFCGNNVQPPVQTLSFDDTAVPFQNTSCSTSITLINNATTGYVLGLMTAKFVDVDDEEFQIEFNQNEVSDFFEPPTIGPGGISQGNVTFDLQNANLTPPLAATVIVVGISGQQVTHFIGNFDCE